MLRGGDLTDLIESDRADVLSVSLDVDPTKPEHQGTHPAYRIWLRNALRDTLDGLPKAARREIEDVAARVLARLEAERPRGRGLVLFAAAGLWREHALPYPVPNRVTYGRPDVVPALWAIEEYQPYAILAVDREHARLLTAYLGETTLLDEDALELDTTDWRFAAGRQPTFTARAGTGAGRGAQRDTFEARVDDHVRRFWHGAAEAAAQALRDRRIERLILGGPDEAAHAVRDHLPEDARRLVVGIVPLPSRADADVIRERTLPVALAEERRREAEVVAQVLDGAAAGRAAAGIEATLDALAQERVMTLVADRDVGAGVWRCTRCGTVSASRVDACPACGGPVEPIALPQVLPRLAQRNGARLELVGGEAAARLRPHGGIGALLRYA